MIASGPTIAFFAAFTACFVEFVEALTIILAVGITRNWFSALTGAAVATVLLTVITAVFGPALSSISVAPLKTVVGVLLLLFGMRWLQTAILRSLGIVPLHDEEATFAMNRNALNAFPAGGVTIDWVGLITSFKAVFLEGIEVVFIVLAIGSDLALLGPAY